MALSQMALPSEQHGIEEFDIEAAIANFLVDEMSSSLELPHMTTGQRKQTKKIIEQHPGLACESYGFGQERQLHLFKKSHRAKAVGTIQGNSTETKPVVFRASPPMLSESLLWSFAAEDEHKLDAPTVNKIEQQLDAASTDCSTVASSSSSSDGSASPRSSIGVMRRKPPGLPTPTRVQVRNTFIHFETRPENDLVVQSMPHGMFGHCFWAEALSERVAEQALLSPSANETTPTHAPFGATIGVATFTQGTQVEINGLVKLPFFNGIKGTVESFDEELGRYNILFPAPVDGHTKAKVKHENLRPVSCLFL